MLPDCTEFHGSSMRKHSQLKPFVYALFTQKKKKGSSEIWSDFIVIKKKTAEQFVYLNNHKQMYKDEQQFSISCVGSL